MLPQDRTFCRICEAHCGLTVARDLDGQVTQLRPDRSHPISQGFVCAKGLRFLEVARHPARLLQPQMRDHTGTLQPVSWDEALIRTADRLKHILDTHGPDAVGVYFGTPMIHTTLGILSIFRFARALGTRNLYSAGSLDNNNKFAAAQILHGNEFIHPIMDLAHAELALLLGTNPLVSQGSMVHLAGGSTAYDAFVARGGTMVIVDPRRSESAQRWGGHIALRPGTDIYLLLALLHELRDLHRPDPRITGLEDLLALAADYPPAVASRLTDIPEATIITLAQQLRDTRRVTMAMSVGVNQGPFGMLCYIVLHALAWLTGNIDREGGLLFQPLSRFLSPLLGQRPQPSRIGGYPSNAGGLPCGILADEITTPGPGQIKALIVIAGNPLVSAPDGHVLRTAFQQLELLVSLDLFENDTGRLAHVLLPTTSWLERADVASWDSVTSQAAFLPSTGPVMPAPGDTRPEYAILARLSTLLDRSLFGWSALATLWGRLPWNIWLPTGIRLLTHLFRTRMQGYAGIPWFPPRPGQYLKRPGQLRFWDATLADEPARLQQYGQTITAARDSHTFTLLGRRRRLAQNSWIHGALHDGPAEAAVWLAPSDMDHLGLCDGAAVIVAGNGAEVQLPATAHPSVAPGHIVIPHGLPDQNVNVLIARDQAFIEPRSGMHQLSGHAVAVRPAYPSSSSGPYDA